jgi:hypothetical protein
MTSTLRSFALSIIALALCSSLALAEDGRLGTEEPVIEARSGDPVFHRAELGRMDNNLSIWGIFSFNYSAGSGLGIGARYQKTIVPEGFIRHSRITDDLGIEGSLEYRHYSWDFGSYNEFDIAAGVVWNVWFTDQFAVYPKLGLGVGFGSWSDDVGDEPDGYGGVYLFGAAGVIYKIDALTLRAELGSNSLQLGVGFTP